MSSLRYKLDNAGRLSRSRNTRTAPYMGTKTAKRIGLRTPNLGCREGVKECVAERSVCGGCSEGICSFDNQWFVGQRTRQSVPGSSEDRVMVRLTICVETWKNLSLEGSCDTMWLENRWPRYTRMHRHAHTCTCQHAHVHQHEFLRTRRPHTVLVGKWKRRGRVYVGKSTPVESQRIWYEMWVVCICGENDTGLDTRMRLYVLWVLGCIC